MMLKVAELWLPLDWNAVTARLVSVLPFTWNSNPVMPDGLLPVRLIGKDEFAKPLNGVIAFT